jgi:hypothetical protein
MILKKFDDIFLPIIGVWDKISYKNIDAKNKLNIILNNRKLIHKFDSDIDDAFLHAICHYYENINIFCIFGKNKEDSYKYYVENYSNDYALYGIKSIKIKSSLIIKVLYQLLFSRMIIKSKNDFCDYLKHEYPFLYNYQGTLIDITILVVCKKDLNKKYPNTDIKKSDFCIFIPNTKESIWNSACLFFSESSIQFLEKQNLDYFLTKDMDKSKKYFLKYRDWLNENVDETNMSQFMLYSSSVLYLLGHRNINDVDLYIHNIPNELIEKTKELKNEEYKFIEYHIKNTELWPKYWDTWLDEWAKLCGAKYFEEILGNPKYHFYFLGVKIISLECDIVRRIKRNRPRAIADLISLRKRYHLNIDIPSIPEKSLKYESSTDKSDEEIRDLVNKGAVLNKGNSEIVIEYNTDIDKFINTVIYALKLNYKMDFTIDDIKRELNMLSRAKKIKVIIKKKDAIT